MKQQLDLDVSLKILNTLVKNWNDADHHVSKAPDAKQLQKQINVSLAGNANNIEELTAALSTYLEYNPNVSHPSFYKLLYSGLNIPALLGDWITSLSNATMHTYQVSPVATLMELELINKWNRLVGFDKGDGVMVSGGSQANLLAMVLARHKACPDIKQNGFQGKTLVAYVSDQAHYSSLKAANVLGIGEQNLISVATDSDGKMDINALRTCILTSKNKGHTPFYIGLTAGTTVVGAFDPVLESSKLAQQYGLWLHIDGCWGGPVLFSQEYKNLISHSYLADSFAWDAHKLMNVPITAGVILVKKPGLLSDACSGGGADYLFHTDANADFNLGEKSIQCGRRADALKVWSSWKIHGDEGFSDKINYLQQLKGKCVEKISKSPCFEMLAPAVYINILFKYSPSNDLTEEQSRLLNINICKVLKDEGIAFIDYAKYKGKTGIRLILANDKTTEEDIEAMLDNCQSAGEKLVKAKNYNLLV